MLDTEILANTFGSLRRTKRIFVCDSPGTQSTSRSTTGRFDAPQQICGVPQGGRKSITLSSTEHSSLVGAALRRVRFLTAKN